MPTAADQRTAPGAILATLSGIANDNLAEGERQEVAARVLNAARRVHEFLDTNGGGEVEVMAAAWDPTAVTAREFAEVLPPRDLDRLLVAAPLWARERLRAARAA